MSVLTQIKTQKVRFVKTLILYGCWVSLGLYQSIPGPTLLDLQILVGTSLDQVTLILPARSGGYALGALVFGCLIDYLNTQLAIIGCMTVSLVAFGCAPWNKTLVGLCATLSINGFALGAMDTIGNIWCIHLWGSEMTPFLQMLHFFWGIGAMVGPLIAEPYLLITETKTDETDHNRLLILEKYFYISNSSGTPSPSPSPTPSPSPSPILPPSPSDLSIQYPYGFASVFTLVVVIIFLVVYFKRPDNAPHPSRVVSETVSGETKINPYIRWIVIAISTLFLHFYFALQITFGSFLAPFVVKSNLHMEKSTGAIISSVFWTFSTFFRIPSLFINLYVGFKNSIAFNLLLIIVANCILLPFGYQYTWAIWVGIVFMGSGLSSVFANFLGYLEQFFPITGGMASTYLIAACAGEFIWPLVVGKFIDSQPNAFLYVSAFCTLSCCTLFIGLIYIFKRFAVKVVSDKQDDVGDVKF